MKTDVVFVPQLKILLLKGFQTLLYQSFGMEPLRYFVVYFSKAELREQALNLGIKQFEQNFPQPGLCPPPL